MSKELYKVLEKKGLLGYGSVILGSMVRDLIGLKIPETASWIVYKELGLVELGAVQYVRNTLLDQGKYLNAVIIIEYCYRQRIPNR
jgi:hypothetical protein